MAEIAFRCYEDEFNFPDDREEKSFCLYDYSAMMHDHDFWEINVILAGNGIHCFDTVEISVKVGDVFVIPPGIPHGYIRTRKLDVYHITMKNSFVSQNLSEANMVKGFLKLMEIAPFLRCNYSDANYLHLTPSQLIQFRSDVAFIDMEGDFASREYAFMRRHMTWKILYWLSHLMDQAGASSGIFGHKYEFQIMQALEVIHLHYDEKLTIGRLCREVYLSRATFFRSFREICGVSPSEYLKDYRCKRALALLESGDYSKTEIAHKCGFYDLSHMERMLK